MAKLRYNGADVYRTDLGKIKRGQIVEVSNEMASRLLNDPKSWEIVEMVDGKRLEGSSRSAEKVKSEKEDKGMKYHSKSEQKRIEEMNKGGEQ